MSAAELVAALERRHGLELALAGPLPGGEVGACEVRAGPRRLVLKRRPGAHDLEAVRRAAALVERLRARGYPAPAYVLVEAVGDATVTLQEWAPGEASDDVSDELVERLLALNALQRGIGGAGGRFGAYLASSLLEGCEGYCLHAPLRARGGRAGALLARVRGIGAALDAAAVPDADVVHLDFHHRNVLQAEGRLAAVVDWDGCRAGDAAFDLVTLAFGLVVARTPERCRERVWAAARASAPPALLEAYAAHMALRQVDWSIRHHSAADVERWLDVAEAVLGAL